MDKVDDLLRVCGALLAPEWLYSWKDLQRISYLPPEQPGLYAWYFDRKLRGVPKRGCHKITRRSLVYVGISPSSARSSGTLRSRIGYHFSGNTSGSTLRTTLASILPALRHHFRRVGGSGTIKLPSRGEDELTDWMRRNARVCWVVQPRPWEIEELVIRSLCLPLNLQHNEGHRFSGELRELRRKAMNGTKRRPRLR